MRRARSQLRGSVGGASRESSSTRLIGALLDMIGGRTGNAIFVFNEEMIMASVHNLPTPNDPTFMSGLVTARELADYRRDGAVCIRGVLSMDEVEAMREATARVIRSRVAKSG